MDILIASGYVDFYVNKKKFESYKTDKGAKGYIENELKTILGSLRGQAYDNIIIRDAWVTSNHFWGEDICVINDIGYSASNQRKLIDPKLNKKAIRVFFVELVCVGDNLKTMFIRIKNENFILNTSTCKII